MKTSNTKRREKIRLFLTLLSVCVIVICSFLIMIHPEVWIAPAGTVIAMFMLLLFVRKYDRRR